MTIVDGMYNELKNKIKCKKKRLNKAAPKSQKQMEKHPPVRSTVGIPSCTITKYM